MQRISRTFGVGTIHRAVRHAATSCIHIVSRPVALPVIAAFAGGVCGLSTAASATVITDGNSPTIAAVTYGNPSTGGFSSSYKNGSGGSLDNPGVMFTKGTAANIGLVPTSPNTTYGDSGYYPPNNGLGTTGSMNDLSPVVSVDYGSANAGFSANAIVFSQRDTTAGDQVSQINVWFLSAPYTETFTPGSNSPYITGSNVTTGTAPGTDSTPSSNIIGSESITITDIGNQTETEYLFPDSASYASRYVVVQLVDTAALNASTGNTPGGLAFNLASDSSVPEPAALGLVGFAVGAAAPSAGGEGDRSRQRP